MATAKKAEDIKIDEENIVDIPKAEIKVKVRIPREDRDQEDKVVWVNEQRYLIKRGVPVEVPESVALILEQEEKMLQYCYDFESKVQR